MTDTLRELYNRDQSLSEVTTEELRALRGEERELWEAVKPLIGLEMIDKINNAQAASIDEVNFIWFRKGFRLGASLMLELLQ